MNKVEAYAASLDLALKTLEAVFMRLNAAENLKPRVPLVERLALPAMQREAAEQTEQAHYDVDADQWASRLCLMSAWEALQAARHAVALQSPFAGRRSPAWTEATACAAEAARLARCGAMAFTEASTPTLVLPTSVLLTNSG